MWFEIPGFWEHAIFHMKMFSHGWLFTSCNRSSFPGRFHFFSFLFDLPFFFFSPSTNKYYMRFMCIGYWHLCVLRCFLHFCVAVVEALSFRLLKHPGLLWAVEDSKGTFGWENEAKWRIKAKQNPTAVALLPLSYQICLSCSRWSVWTSKNSQSLSWKSWLSSSFNKSNVSCIQKSL